MVQREKQKVSRELKQAKMELAAAHDVGEAALLRQVALRYPAQLETLSDFVAGLYATDLDEQEAALTVTAEIEAVTMRARQRALSAVFSAVAAPQTSTAPVSTLFEVRRARGLTLVALARQMTLGADVVQKLEKGRILAASVPQRLVNRLAETLALSQDQVWMMLRATSVPEIQPKLLRRRSVGKIDPSEGQAVQPQAFAEAVQRSPEMTTEQQATWLEETQQD